MTMMFAITKLLRPSITVWLAVLLPALLLAACSSSGPLPGEGTDTGHPEAEEYQKIINLDDDEFGKY